MSATIGQVRGTAFLVLASLATACGFDFNRFEPTASLGTSSGGGLDGDAASAVDGASDDTRDAQGDALSNADVTSDAATFDGPPGQSADGGCTSDVACSANAPYCSPKTAQCVECTTSTNCSGTSSPICAPSQQCVQCLTNGDCSGGTPYCSVTDGGGGSCVQCTQSSQCTVRKPICNSGRCG
jgi:hypothetical protein